MLRIERTAIVEAQWVDNGPGWIAVMLESAHDVLAVEPAKTHHRRIDVGIIGPYPSGGDVAFEVRAIFSDERGGLIEDPVTGSLNAALGQWLFETGRAVGRYIASQGTAIGRTGRLELHRDSLDQVWVGGRTVTLFTGQSCDDA